MNNDQYLLKLKDAMELKGNAQGTIYTYKLILKQLFEFVDKPVHEITTQDIKNYLLFQIKNGLDPATINSKHSMILIFFKEVLEKPEIILPIPYLKRKKRLPVLLTKEEVKEIINHAPNLKSKAILMVIYSSGLRLSEAANLKVSDIDSKRMQLFVRQGKGGKDRYTVLSQKALECLREYYRAYRPEDWLFPPRLDKKNHIGKRSIQEYFDRSLAATGITKKVSTHSLRHAFASHMLENETDLLSIMHLLGHDSLRTTQVYLHLSPAKIHNVVSPLDLEVSK